MRSSSSASSKPPVSNRRASSGGRIPNNNDEEFEDAPDMSGDHPNYTVLMPPTPDNQPSGGSKPGDLPLPPYGSGKVVNRRGGADEGAAKMERRLSTARVPSPSTKSLLVRSQTGDFDHNRWLFETKGTYGIGNAYWPQDDGPVKMEDLVDKPWKPLSRKVAIPPGILSPYRFELVYILSFPTRVLK